MGGKLKKWGRRRSDCDCRADFDLGHFSAVKNSIFERILLVRFVCGAEGRNVERFFKP